MWARRNMGCAGRSLRASRNAFDFARNELGRLGSQNLSHDLRETPRSRQIAFDACVAVQAKPGSPPSHPAAAAQGRELGRLRGWIASAPQHDSMVYFADDAIAAWAAAPRTTRGGQPSCSLVAILTALTRRAVFRLGKLRDRSARSSVCSALTLRVPDHTAIAWSRAGQ